MQEPCQLCGIRRVAHEHWLHGGICDWCYDRMKWSVWHEGITPVREKE